MRTSHWNNEIYNHSERYSSYYESNSYTRKSDEYNEKLQPLIKKLKEYDSLRIQLETEGGNINLLSRFTKLLNEKFTLGDGYSAQSLSLSDQSSIKHALWINCDGDVRVDVRFRVTGMPVYYLSRVMSDHWSEHSLIVEDYYMSSNYPIVDDRFVKLMRAGHEVNYLRLSQFRNNVDNLIQEKKMKDMWTTDEIIFSVGRQILQAAWHEDQRPGIQTANLIGLPIFRYAVELLYLCLSGELCELRSNMSEPMKKFFTDVYPQPAISAFLNKLFDLEGEELNNMSQNVLPLYSKLSKKFMQFLSTEVIWGIRGVKVPLYKLIFSNFSRLEVLKNKLLRNNAIVSAAEKLENSADVIMKSIL